MSRPIIQLDPSSPHDISPFSPGLYQIYTSSSKTDKVLLPKKPGDTLTVGSDTSAQIWEIRSEGAIFSTDTTSGMPLRTTTSGDLVVASIRSWSNWIFVGIIRSGDYQWTGSIMANDGTDSVWSVDQNNNTIAMSPKDSPNATFYFEAVY
ncbi:hypothetical protein BDP27DRAFT_1454475 [Rhodocollybia butyracea]|uniref:Uncharacterized protein n=1 Tax=Rhodocollybia butyracea TaxID=206335 RepID=A0A9P5P694_9AGAR|nr:hypothetical protein BDP27DRAFT_1454475 [Rhodocollybia butyracea]